MSSRSFKSASTDIDATLALAIATSRQRETNVAICQRETNVTTRATVLGAPRSGGGRYLLTSPFLLSRYAVSLCARIAQSAIIAAARAMPVVTIGANSATVFQKAASSHGRGLNKSHSIRTNKTPIAIIRRSCSDSSVTASQMDRVFRSDRIVVVAA